MNRQKNGEITPKPLLTKNNYQLLPVIKLLSELVLMFRKCRFDCISGILFFIPTRSLSYHLKQIQLRNIACGISMIRVIYQI